MYDIFVKKIVAFGIVILVIGTGVLPTITASKMFTTQDKEGVGHRIELENTGCLGFVFLIAKIQQYKYGYLDGSGPGYWFEITNGWYKAWGWMNCVGFFYQEGNCSKGEEPCWIGIFTLIKRPVLGILTQKFVCAIFPVWLIVSARDHGNSWRDIPENEFCFITYGI